MPKHLFTLIIIKSVKFYNEQSDILIDQFDKNVDRQEKVCYYEVKDVINMEGNTQTPVIIDGISLAIYCDCLPKDIWSAYKDGRKVCGLVFSVSGKTKFSFTDGTYRVIEPGEIALFSEKAAYICENPYEERNTHYTINFSTAEGHGLTQPVLFAKPSSFDFFDSICRKIVTSFHSGRPLSQMHSISALYEAIAHILENDVIEAVGKQAYLAVEPARAYIDEHFADEITSFELSKLCTMGHTSFRQTFKKVYGVSPIAYLIDVRINRAKELLLSQETLPISAIASRCGFKDVEHFCRTFRQKTGFSASSFKAF